VRYVGHDQAYQHKAKLSMKFGFFEYFAYFLAANGCYSRGKQSLEESGIFELQCRSYESDACSYFSTKFLNEHFVLLIAGQTTRVLAHVFFITSFSSFDALTRPIF
jgi:hypothetical protein